MKYPDSIIHIELLGPKEHHHFGSLAAVFEHLTEDQVGISLAKLYRNEQFKKNYKFVNEKCIITKAEVKRKKHTVK